MKIKPIFLTGVIGLAMLAGCTKDEIDHYSGGLQVYFERVAGSGTADSMTYSFAVRSDELQFDTVEIPIVITGSKSTVAHEVNIAVVKEKTTAAEGTDYVMTRAVIPAGEYRTFLKIRINRSPEMKTQERCVFLQILPTVELGTDVDTNWVDFKLKINDILTKPARWIYECQPYFGVYSEVKYRFIVKTLGIWDFPDSGVNAIPKAQMLYYQDKMKSELARWEKEEGKPMTDEKGNKVTF